MFRKNSQEISAIWVADIVIQLENDGNNLCSRIDAPTFCTVFEALVQIKPCREAERGLYLLGVS